MCEEFVVRDVGDLISAYSSPALFPFLPDTVYLYIHFYCILQTFHLEVDLFVEWSPSPLGKYYKF
jgi:hypothetical protein